MDWELRRSGGGPPKGAFWASLILHVGVVALLLVGQVLQPEPLEFVTYQIQMVSLPAEQAPEEQAEPATQELVVETPDPQPPQPESEALPPPPREEEERTPEPKPDPKPPETKPDPQPQPPPEPAREETPPRTDPVAEPNPEETPSAEINVRMEGLRRDYPEYYRNILFQIRRCFMAPPGARSLTTVLYFEITRDGTVSAPRIVERSGNPQFDLAALAAVADCAGRGRFGPLPADLPYDRLPVQFTFRPPGDDTDRDG